MRLRRLRSLAALALMIGGCGKPEIVPMMPPGVAYRKSSTDTMEAEGETGTRGAARAVNVSPDGPAVKATPVPVGQPAGK